MLTVKPENGRVGFPKFSNMFENLFENEFPAFIANEVVRGSVPSVNIKDTKDAYLIDVAAPGFTRESFSVKIEDSILTIVGEKATDKLEEGEKYTRKEFHQASFKRSFTLPKTIVADSITAAYENGILRVSLPKLEESKAKGTIEVKIS